MLVCPACGQATRTGARLHDDGSKHRVCKRKDCGKEVGQLSPARNKIQVGSPPPNNRCLAKVGFGRQSTTTIRPSRARIGANETIPSPARLAAEDQLCKTLPSNHEAAIMAKKQKQTEEAGLPAGPPPTPRLLEKYRSELARGLAEKIRARPIPMRFPKVEKIVINMGVGEAVTEKKFLEEAVAALTQISGQKPQVTKSRQSIAGFRAPRGNADRLQGDAPRGADV